MNLIVEFLELSFKGNNIQVHESENYFKNFENYLKLIEYLIEIISNENFSKEIKYSACNYLFQLIKKYWDNDINENFKISFLNWLNHFLNFLPNELFNIILSLTLFINKNLKFNNLIFEFIYNDLFQFSNLFFFHIISKLFFKSNLIFSNFNLINFFLIKIENNFNNFNELEFLLIYRTLNYYFFLNKNEFFFNNPLIFQLLLSKLSLIFNLNQNKDLLKFCIKFSFNSLKYFSEFFPTEIIIQFIEIFSNFISFNYFNPYLFKFLIYSMKFETILNYYYLKIDYFLFNLIYNSFELTKKDYDEALNNPSEFLSSHFLIDYNELSFKGELSIFFLTFFDYFSNLLNDFLEKILKIIELNNDHNIITCLQMLIILIPKFNDELLNNFYLIFTNFLQNQNPFIRSCSFAALSLYSNFNFDIELLEISIYYSMNDLIFVKYYSLSLFINIILNNNIINFNNILNSFDSFTFLNLINDVITFFGNHQLILIIQPLIKIFGSNLSVFSQQYFTLFINLLLEENQEIHIIDLKETICSYLSLFNNNLDQFYLELLKYFPNFNFNIQNNVIDIISHIIIISNDFNEHFFEILNYINLIPTLFYEDFFILCENLLIK